MRIEAAKVAIKKDEVARRRVRTEGLASVRHMVFANAPRFLARWYRLQWDIKCAVVWYQRQQRWNGLPSVQCEKFLCDRG